MISLQKKNKKKENLINGCRFMPVSDETEDFMFCSDVIVLNTRNQVGIEFNDGGRIRIDGVICTDRDSFVQMMDALVEFGKTNEYKYLYFADSLETTILNLFLKYGFQEEHVYDPYNHYLKYEFEWR